MKKFEAVPALSLRPYVDRYWGWESEEDECVALPILLTGTGADLFIHYRAPFAASIDSADSVLPSAHLVCVRSQPIHLKAARDVGFVAIRFRIGGVHRFVRLSGRELLDETPSADDLWPRARLDLCAITDATSFNARVALVERHLLRLLDQTRGDELAATAARHIYQAKSRASIDRVAASFAISRRQLERRVKDWTGQTPNDIRVTSRLQKTIRDLALNPDLGILEAALNRGYFDQSHFAKDFQTANVGTPQQFRGAGGLMTHFYNISTSDCAFC